MSQMSEKSTIDLRSEIVVFFAPGQLKDLPFSKAFLKRYHTEMLGVVPSRVADPVAAVVINMYGWKDIGDGIRVIVYPKELVEHVRFDNDGIPYIDDNSFVVAKLARIPVNTGEVPASMVSVRKHMAKALEKQARWL